jgi:hypothetical protein
MTLYEQVTGKVHMRRDCSVARRTRYGTVPFDAQPEDIDESRRCKRCWKTDK